MLLDDLWRLFEAQLFPVPSAPGLFNPYRDRDAALDLPDAPFVRRENLRRYLAAYAARPPVLLLAEAPGPRGCRFSGVPFTSEAQLVDPAFPLSGRPSGTQERPYTEYSGGIYWRVLRPYFPHFFTWNSVPFHPHRPGAPLSIRNPTGREVRRFAEMLAALLAILQPTCVLAIGRKAEYALGLVGQPHTYVRHPSQGGAVAFEEGVRAAFRARGLADAG